MGITLRNGNFRADVYHDGKRMRKTFDNQNDAKVWLEVTRHALMSGKSVPQNYSGLTTTKYTFKSFADRVFALKWKDKTYPVKKQKQIEGIVDYFGDRTLIEDITYDKITDFVLYCIREKTNGGLGNSGGTANRKLSTISVILRQAHREGKISKMPHIEKQKEKGGRQRWLTVEEAKAILATAEWMGNIDLYHAIKVSLDTGIRSSELLRIKRDDITKQGLIVPVRKSKKLPTMIPLTTKSRAILDVRSKTVEGDRLFPFNDGWYKTAFNKLKDANRLQHLDLSDVCWHTLRHTTCSWLVQRGVSLVRVQQIMGHSNISTTMIYAHLAPIDEEEYVNPLED